MTKIENLCDSKKKKKKKKKKWITPYLRNEKLTYDNKIICQIYYYFHFLNFLEYFNKTYLYKYDIQYWKYYNDIYHITNNVPESFNNYYKKMFY